MHSTPFDPLAFPGIVHSLLALLGADVLHTLRRVSHRYRDLADSILAEHITINCVTRSDSRIDLEYSRSYKGTTFKIPGLEPFTPFTSSDDVPDNVRRVLGLTKTLDVYVSSRNHSLSASSFEQGVQLCTYIAPHLTNLVHVIVHEYFWPAPFPFTPSHRLTTFAGIKRAFQDGAPVVYPHLSLKGPLNKLVVMITTFDSLRYIPDNFTPPPSPTYPSSVTNVTIFLMDYCIDGEQPTRITAVAASLAALSLDPQAFITGCIKYSAFVGIQSQSSDQFPVLFEEEFLSSFSKLLQQHQVAADKQHSIMKQVTIFILNPKRPRRWGEIPPTITREEIYPTFKLHKVIEQATVAKINTLEDAFLSQTNPFTVAGSISLQGPLLLYFQNQTTGQGLARVSVPLTADSSALLHNAGAPSPFGRGAETVFDETYRTAREIKPPNFSLSGDILVQNTVLQAIQNRLNTKPLHGTLAKLNVYPTGGFFKAHRDTPRGDNHLGTLTLCLPSPFTGGQLVVSHKGKREVFDWAETAGSDHAVIPWAFLYSDCEHEVLPVESGMRVTIAYDIFVTRAVRKQISQPSACTSVLSAVLEDPNFFPEGGILAFGLQHEYAKVPSKFVAGHGYDRRWNAALLSMMKGVDSSWAQCLSAAGLKFEFVAIYDSLGLDEYDEDDDENSDEEEDDDSGEDEDEDEYEDRDENRKERPEKLAYRGRHYAVSRDFYEWQDKNEQNDDCGSVTQVPGQNVHWVTLPGAWGIQNHYLAYGNEAMADVKYVSVGIYAYVGPPGERTSWSHKTFDGREHGDSDEEGEEDEEDWESANDDDDDDDDREDDDSDADEEYSDD